jgi:hypothetical protein
LRDVLACDITPEPYATAQSICCIGNSSSTGLNLSYEAFELGVTSGIDDNLGPELPAWDVEEAACEEV